jgi:hypothetical protein
MAKKIPLKIGDDKVTAKADDFEVSVTIPKKYRKILKYVALIASFVMLYFGYELIV